MIYAVISDIHSNHHSLVAALRRAEDERADGIMVAGDICGKGPQPFEVLETLSAVGPVAVKGNADEKFAASRMARNKLTKKQKRLLSWLEGLPRVAYGGDSILVCHGSPHKVNDYIYPSITPEGLKSKLGGVRPPGVLCCGHSHIPFVKRVADTLVVNAGSAGRPIDGDPRGSMAFFRTGGPVPEGEIARFPYDLDGLVSVMTRGGASGRTISSYLLGLRNGR